MHRGARYGQAWGAVGLVFMLAFGLTLIAMIPVLGLAAFHAARTAGGSEALSWPELWNDPVFYYGSTAAQAAGFVAAAILVHRKPAHRGWTLGAAWNARTGLQLAAGAVLGFLLFAAALIVLSGSGAVAGFHRADSNTMPAMAWHLLLLVLVTVNEEVFVQGFAQGVLTHRLGRTAGLLGPAAVFTLLHAGNPGAWDQAGLPLLNTALFGLLLALVRERSGGLWLPIGVHGAWYAAQGLVFGFPVSGTAMPSIWVPELADAPLWTGGRFGAEGSAAVTALLAVCALWLLRRRKSPAIRQISHGPPG